MQQLNRLSLQNCGETFMIMLDEKQDINSDFNHVKHVPNDKDQTCTDTTVQLLTGLCAFFPLGGGASFFTI